MRRREWTRAQGREIRMLEQLESRVMLDAWDVISDVWSDLPDYSYIDTSTNDYSSNGDGGSYDDGSGYYDDGSGYYYDDGTYYDSGYYDGGYYGGGYYGGGGHHAHPPSAPAQLTAVSPSSSSVFLSWTNTSGNQDRVKVKRFGPSGLWETIATVRGDSTQYTDTTVEAGEQYSYYLVASNEDGNSNASNIATVTVVDNSDPTLIGRFGHLAGGFVPVPFAFFDGDGTEVLVTLSGAGSAEIHMNASGYDFSVTGTNLQSAVMIKTMGTGGDDGRLAVHDFVVGNPLNPADHTALGKLCAGTADFSGVLTITGPAGTVALGDVTGETISIGAPAGALPAVPTMALSFGRIADTTIDSAIGISCLTAIDWRDSDAAPDALTAPTVGKLKITGQKKIGAQAAIAGDFAAALTLSGSGAGQGNVLGSASIAGAVGALTWDVEGKIGKICVGAAGSADGAFVLTGATDIAAMNLGNVIDARLGDGAHPLKAIGSLTAKNWAAGSLVAESVKTLKVTGNLQMDLTLLGAAKGLTLGCVSAAGVIGGTWVMDGGVGKIAAKSASGWTLSADDAASGVGAVKSVTLTDRLATSTAVQIAAASMGSLSAKGNLDGWEVTLRQVPEVKRVALGKMSVGGVVRDSAVRAAGNIGSVRVGVLDHSVIFAGVLDGVAGLPGAGNFAAAGLGGLAKIGSVTVPGVKGLVGVLINSYVAAASIGKVLPADRLGAVVDEDLAGAFGFVTLEAVGRYVGEGSSGFYVSGADSVV